MSITFQSIERSLDAVDLTAFTAQAAAPEAPAPAQRLVALYRAVRPILSAVAALPLLPPRFTSALQLFLTTFDQFAAADPAFKSGRDL